jgi:hypothetical protein
MFATPLQILIESLLLGLFPFMDLYFPFFFSLFLIVKSHPSLSVYTSFYAVSRSDISYKRSYFLISQLSKLLYIQGVFESCAQILTMSYWLHVEFGKNILKILSKNKMTFIF